MDGCGVEDGFAGYIAAFLDVADDGLEGGVVADLGYLFSLALFFFFFFCGCNVM